VPFSIAEIRDRAKELKNTIAFEQYSTQAGLKERLPSEKLYKQHQFLLAPGVLPAIQRRLAAASWDERRRLTALFNWVARQRVEAQLAPLEDELYSWESIQTISLADRKIPLQRVSATIMRTDQRSKRLAWESARDRRTEEATALRLDILHREREAVDQLGLGSYIASWERLTGLNLRGIKQHAHDLLNHTDLAYRQMFQREVNSRIEVKTEPATRADAQWLIGMRWLAQPFAINPILTGLRRDLEKMGLPLPYDGTVRIDLDRRRFKRVQSFCSGLRIPGNVVAVIFPVGGWVDIRSLLHEVGHTLHFAYTSPTLEWEERHLGDTTVTDSFAHLFESLTLDRAWIQSTTGLSAATLDEYMSLASFLQLYRIRQQAAQFLWEMELAASEHPGDLAVRYGEILSEATGFSYDPVTYIEDVTRGFSTARRLRGRMLSAVMLDSLKDRFGLDWFHNPAAGKFLGEILSAGQRDDAAQLAQQLGDQRLTPGPLLRQIDKWPA